MTIAICLRCGHEKIGAFTPCSACGYEPADKSSRAKALLLSDHHATPDQLRSAADSIREGREPPLDQRALDEVISELARNPVPRRKPFGCLISTWILVAVMLALGILDAYLLLHR